MAGQQDGTGQALLTLSGTDEEAMGIREDTDSDIEEHILTLFRQVQALDRDDLAVHIGVIDAAVRHYFPEAVHSEAVITGRQRRHYLNSHPEVAFYERHIIQAMIRPDEVHEHPDEEDCFIHYAQVDESHYVMVAMRYSRRAETQHSVITALYVRDRARRRGRETGRFVWGRRG
jgi:hypothetical protein